MNFKYLENIKHVLEFREAKKNVARSQEKLLLKIIKRNAKTEYGLKYGFSKVKSISDFQKFVPLTDYDSLKPFIDSLIKGNNNVLTKDKVVFFATTSGTTKAPKLIPITGQRIVSFKKELSLWSFKFLRLHPKVLTGKLLYFAGPYNEGKTDSGIMFGSISGYLAHKTSWLLKRKLVVPPKLYNEFDFDRKMREVAKLAIRSNITQLGFAFPVEVLMFFDYVKNNKDSLLEDIKKEGHWLKARLLKKKDFSPMSLWPNLSVVNCIKSLANKPYIDELERLLPGVLINDPGIYSSEGRVSLCVSPGADFGLLPVTINFFEFRCVNSKKLFLAHELKQDDLYEVIMTTPEGLYRYELGDIVKVIGFKDSVPLIKFHDRDNYLNIAGELAHERILLESINAISAVLKLKLRGATFMPDKPVSKKKPCYNVLIEPVKVLSKKDAKTFLVSLEKELQKNIVDYRQMRNEFGRLEAPCLSVAKLGEFDKFDKKRLNKGGQLKPLIISKDSSFVDNFDLDFIIH